MKSLNHFLTGKLFMMAALAWLLSCGEKKPEDILTKQEMVRLMQEMYIAEEKVNHLALARDSSKVISSFMLTRVFENAGVNDTIFEKSFNYYMERPQEMEFIYTALVDTLQLREQRTSYRPDQP